MKLRPIFLLCAVATASLLTAQTTVTYTDGETNATTYDTTGDTYTLTIASGSATQSGIISGSGTWTKSGAGTLTLSGTNTFTSAIGVGAGTLILASDTATGTTDGTTTVGASGTLSLSNDITVDNEFVNNLGLVTNLSGANSIAGIITGTGALTVTSGTMTLTGANNYSGTTTVSAGTLRIGDGGSTGSLGTGGLVNNSAVVFNRTGTLTYAGDISGTGTITNSATGTVLLNGSNSYTGDTTISTGTLSFGSTSAFYGGTVDATNAAKVSVADGATLGLGIGSDNGFSLADTNLIRSNATLTGSARIALDTTNATDGNATWTNTNFGSNDLNKIGTGTLTLDGTTTHTGDTNVENGTLAFAETNAFYGGTIDATNAAKISVSDGASLAPALTGSSPFSNANLTTIATNTSFSSGSFLSLDTTAASGGNITLTGLNIGAVALKKTGSNSLTLNGTTTHTGNTEVESGVLIYAADTAFYGGTVDATNTAKLTVRSGATASFALGGSGYFSSSDLDTVVSNATLEAGSFIGVDTSEIGSTTLTQDGSYGLKKTGTGTLTLDAASTGTGSFNVAGGTLAIGNITSGTLSTTSITNNSELVFSPSSSLAFSGTIDGTGNFTKNGAGELTLSNLTSTGTINVTAGNLILPTDIDDRSATISGASASLTDSGVLPDIGKSTTGSLNITSGGSYVLSSTSSLNYLTIGSSAGSEGTITVDGTGSNITSSGRLRVASSGTGTLTIENGGSATFDRASDSFLGNTSTGVGTVTLTGTDSALTTGGRLVVGNAGSGTLTIGSGSTVTADRLQLAQDVGSTGTLNLNDGGNLIVSDANGTALETGDGTAAFNFAGGTLKSNGSNNLTVTSNATLASSTTSTIDTNGQTGTFSGILSGTGNITKTGSGILNLTAANTHTGTTTISVGTLALGADGTIANSSDINLGTTGSTGTLDVTAKSSFSIDSGQTLTGVGTVALGGDTLTLSSGATFAPGNSAGLVTISGDFTLNSGSIINLELGGLTRGTQYDAFDVTGTLTLGGTLNVSLIDDYAPTGESTYNLFDAASVGGTFAAINLPSVTNGTWNSTNLATTGEITLTVSAVPEPSSFAAIAALFALGFATTRRRRRIETISQ